MFKNFCCRNAVVSELYDDKSRNKIAVVFFLIPMARLNILVEPNLVKDKPDVQSSPFDACDRMCTCQHVHH